MKIFSQVMKIVLFFGVLAGAGMADAESKKKSLWNLGSESSPSGGASWDSSLDARSMALGFKRYTSTGGTSVWALHGLHELKNSWTLGAGFGFDADFDTVVFSAELRKGVYKAGSASLFSEVNAGFLKLLKSHFIAGARLGFQYGLSEKLKLDATYGVELMLGNTSNHFGISQPTDFAGSFGIHWFF